MSIQSFIKSIGKSLPLEYRQGYFDGFEAGYKESIKNLVDISPKLLNYIAEEKLKLRKESDEVKS